MILQTVKFKCGHLVTMEVDRRSTAHDVVAAQHDCSECFVKNPQGGLLMGPPPDATQRIRIRAEETNG